MPAGVVGWLPSCFGIVVLWVGFFGFGLIDLVGLGFGRVRLVVDGVWVFSFYDGFVC